MRKRYRVTIASDSAQIPGAVACKEKARPDHNAHARGSAVGVSFVQGSGRSREECVGQVTSVSIGRDWIDARGGSSVIIWKPAGNCKPPPRLPKDDARSSATALSR